MSTSDQPSLLRSHAKTSILPISLPSTLVSCGLTEDNSNKKEQNPLVAWCASSHNLNVISNNSREKLTVSKYSCRPGSSLLHANVDSKINYIWTLQSDNVLTCWHHHPGSEISGPNDEKNAHLMQKHTFPKKKYASLESMATNTIVDGTRKYPYWMALSSSDSNRNSKKSSKNTSYELVIASVADQSDQTLSLNGKKEAQSLSIETIPLEIPGFKCNSDKILNKWITMTKEVPKTRMNGKKRKFAEKEYCFINIQFDFVLSKNNGGELQYWKYTIRKPLLPKNNEDEDQTWVCEHDITQSIQLPIDNNIDVPSSLQITKFKRKKNLAFAYPLVSVNTNTDSESSVSESYQCTLIDILSQNQRSNGKKDSTSSSNRHFSLLKPTSTSQLQGIESLANALLVAHWCDSDGGESIVDIYHTQRCLLLNREHYYNDDKVAFSKTNGTTSLAMMESSKIITSVISSLEPPARDVSLAQSLSLLNPVSFKPLVKKEYNLNQLWNEEIPADISQQNVQTQNDTFNLLESYRDVFSAKKVSLLDSFENSIENNSDQQQLSSQKVANVLFETAVSVAMDVILSCEIACRRLKQEPLEDDVNEDKEQAGTDEVKSPSFYRSQQLDAARVLLKCFESKEFSARAQVMTDLSLRHKFKQNGPLLALFLSLRSLRTYLKSNSSEGKDDFEVTPLGIIRSMVTSCLNLNEHMIIAMIRYVISYVDSDELELDMRTNFSWYETFSKSFHLKFNASDKNSFNSKTISRSQIFWTSVVLCLRTKRVSSPNPALLRSAILQQRMSIKEVSTWLQVFSAILKRTSSVEPIAKEFSGSSKHVIQMISAVTDAHMGQLLQSSFMNNDDSKSMSKLIKEDVQEAISFAKVQAEVTLGLDTLLKKVESHLHEANETTNGNSSGSPTSSLQNENYVINGQKSLDDKFIANERTPLYSLERLVF